MSKHLVYQGPGGLRILGKADGLDRDYEFPLDRPVEVTVADAKAILERLPRHEFAEASDDEVKAEKSRAAAEAEREAAEEAAVQENESADTAGPPNHDKEA